VGLVSNRGWQHTCNVSGGCMFGVMLTECCLYLAVVSTHSTIRYQRLAGGVDVQCVMFPTHTSWCVLSHSTQLHHSVLRLKGHSMVHASREGLDFCWMVVGASCSGDRLLHGRDAHVGAKIC
jgi:hypothetical protein